MTGLSSKECMEGLHGLVTEVLTAKIKSSECTAADLNAAIKFLKDNGVEAVMTSNSPLEKLKTSLPQFTDDDIAFSPNQTANEPLN